MRSHPLSARAQIVGSVVSKNTSACVMLKNKIGVQCIVDMLVVNSYHVCVKQKK
jgi:hypothetical protein